MQIITIAAFHSPKVHFPRNRLIRNDYIVRHDIQQLQSSKYMCAQTIINFCGFFTTNI